LKACYAIINSFGLAPLETSRRYTRFVLSSLVALESLESALQSFHDRFAITLQRLCNGFASLCNRLNALCDLALQSLCDRIAIVSQSLCDLALQLLLNRFAIT
jgi:hypothetical protein